MQMLTNALSFSLTSHKKLLKIQNLTDTFRQKDKKNLEIQTLTSQLFSQKTIKITPNATPVNPLTFLQRLC